MPELEISISWRSIFLGFAGIFLAGVLAFFVLDAVSYQRRGPGPTPVARAQAAWSPTPTPTPGWWQTLAAGTTAPTPPVMSGATPTPATSATPAVKATPAPTATPVSLKGKILFLTDREPRGWWEEPVVYYMDPDGSGQARLPDQGQYALALRWEPYSPDRRLLAVVEDPQEGDGPALFARFTRDSALWRQLTGGHVDYEPAWSPDSEWVAYTSQADGNDEIHKIGLHGQGDHRLTSNTWEWDKHATWSPDSKQIAFWSNRGTGRRQIWVMNADGSGQRNLSNNGFNDWAPVWVK